MRLQTNLFILLFILVASSQRSVQAQEKVFYEKSLADKRKIIVIRKSIPYKPITEEDKKKLAQQSPGAYYEEAKAEASYEYSLYSIDEKVRSRKLLWQKKMTEFTIDGERDLPLKIYDVAFTSNTLLVVYRLNTFVVGEVATVPFPHSIQRIEFDDTLIQESNSTSPGSILSAVI